MLVSCARRKPVPLFLYCAMHISDDQSVELCACSLFFLVRDFLSAFRRWKKLLSIKKKKANSCLEVHFIGISSCNRNKKSSSNFIINSRFISQFLTIAFIASALNGACVFLRVRRNPGSSEHLTPRHGLEIDTHHSSDKRSRSRVKRKPFGHLSLSGWLSCCHSLHHRFLCLSRSLVQYRKLHQKNVA